MKKTLLIIALIISGLGLNAQGTLESPKNLTAEAKSDTRINLTWDAVENATGYIVYSGETLLQRQSETSLLILELDPSTEYCFSVSAVFDDAESDKSKQACATTFDEISCPVPTNLKSKVELNDPNYGKKYKITVTWDAVEGAELYGVYIATQYYPDGMFMGSPSTNEFVTGSDVEGELYFSVRTVCDNENGVFSERSEEIPVVLNEDVVVDELVPPTNFTAEAKSASSIELKWDEVSVAMSYFVYRDGEEIANIKETTYVDNNLNPNTEYCYTITSMGGDRESDPTEKVCEKTNNNESISEYRNDFNIYPNPVENELYIETEMSVEEISVYDVFGRKLSAVSYQQSVVDVTELNSGVYFVKVRTSEGEIVKRFVKE